MIEIHSGKRDADDGESVRVGIYLDETRRCCARTLEGPELRVTAPSYRRAVHALQRLLHAHHGYEVSVKCELLLDDALAERLRKTRMEKHEWLTAGNRLRSEQASLVQALRELRLTTQRIAQMLGVSATGVTALERTTSEPRRRRLTRVPTRMLAPPG